MVVRVAAEDKEKGAGATLDGPGPEYVRRSAASGLLQFGPGRADDPAAVRFLDQNGNPVEAAALFAGAG